MNIDVHESLTTLVSTPTTIPPTTLPPTTIPPTTIAPTTAVPTTQIPTTIPPTTVIPTTIPPTTSPPTTIAPTTVIPTTQVPTTIIPTTQSPTTQSPTTIPPTTPIPTTIVPTTQSPTTIPPTTIPPTSIVPSTLIPSIVCDDNKMLVTLVRMYSTNASEEQFKFYEGITTDNLLYEESYSGTTTTETTLCVESTVHKLILIDSGGNGWSSGSKLIITSESQELGEFSLSSGSSLEILIHPIIGIIDETPISDCSELFNLPLNATSLIMESNICNSNNVTIFNITDYDSIVLVDISDNNLMYVNEFIIDGLNHLNSLCIGMNSFTTAKNSFGNNLSRSFSILNCDELESIEIGRYSFSDYSGGFELFNLPNLATIKIGHIGGISYNFRYSSFVIKGIIDVVINNE